jgi:hypothetical protein
MNKYDLFQLILQRPRTYKRVIEDEHGLVNIWHNSPYCIVPTMAVSTPAVDMGQDTRVFVTRARFVSLKGIEP